MSRVAKKIRSSAAGVDISFSAAEITVKGSLGSISMPLNGEVDVKLEETPDFLPPRQPQQVRPFHVRHHARLVNNMVIGVSKGFERKLTLVGVGYRAQGWEVSPEPVSGFSRGCSPDAGGREGETRCQTEILLKGVDKQKVGVRSLPKSAPTVPPGTYKGRGVRYADEKVVLKETKKK